MNLHSKPMVCAEQGPYKVGADSWLNRDSAFEMRSVTCLCAAPPETDGASGTVVRGEATRGYAMAAAADPGQTTSMPHGCVSSGVRLPLVLVCGDARVRVWRVKGRAPSCYVPGCP